MFLMKSMSSFGIRAPMPSRALIVFWISLTSSSASIVVGSTIGLVEPEVRDHGVEVRVGREGAEVAQGRELPVDVVGRGRHEQAEEGQPPRLGQAADDAEVEQGGAAVGEHEQVPAVQVAVEDAVDHGALHEADHPGADDGLGVDAGVAHAGHVVELEALEPLHHQHARGDELGVRAGDHVVALAELGERLGHVEHVLRPRCGSRAPR